MKDFFISYNTADQNWAEWIAWQLEEAGYSVVIQAWDFKAGQNFVLEMQNATTQCRKTIVVLSPNFLKAQFTQPEWAAAFAQDPTGEKGKIIPIRVLPCDLKGLQKAIIYIDLVGLSRDRAKKRLLAKIKSGRAKPETEPEFPGELRKSARTIRGEPTFPGLERNSVTDGDGTKQTNRSAWITAMAVIAAAIIAGIFGLIPLCQKQIIDFELNGSHFNPNSFITIRIKGAVSIKNKDLVILLDGCPIDYCLEKMPDHWRFNPGRCDLPDELLAEGKHELCLRIAKTADEKKYMIYFDSEPPALALEKTVAPDKATATFTGMTTDRGMSPGDTIYVDIMLWNGDRYERTELPVNKFVNNSGQIVWGFQANVKRIPRLEPDDPNFTKTFCRIQVHDQAKNIAAYELPYSQVFASGISRTLVGDTEILLGRPGEPDQEWKPKWIPIDIAAPSMIKKPLTDTDKFTLVVYVLSKNHVEIGVENLPPDAVGNISYFKNDKLMQQTERTKVVDREAAPGDFNKYYATVKGKDNKIYRTDTAFSIEAEMVFVSGGTFQMGSNDDEAEDDEKPVHEVFVSSFYISKYEITQKQWTAVMGSNPSFFKGDYLPIESVSWEDCQRFIGELNKITGKRYRLPTEAEWEYAAKGGNRSRGFKYSGSDNVDEVAWYGGNSNGKTHPVGRKRPNELGLFDMSGNVWEWCADWYDENYYQNSPRNNPGGPSSGEARVLRGGSWIYNYRSCRTSNRDGYLPDSRDNYRCFRVVQDAPQ